MSKFINLTPHAVRLRTDAANTAPTAAESDIIIASSGVARVATTPGKEIGSADGVALYGRTVFGEVEGLPAPAPGTIFIVSALVAGRVTGRDDVFAPGTGPKDGAVRDEKGQIYAVTRLVQAG